MEDSYYCVILKPALSKRLSQLSKIPVQPTKIQIRAARIQDF